MDASPRTTYVAECFWPGVRPADVEEVAERVRRSTGELTRAGTVVELRSSIVMPADEVVFYLFGGVSIEAVEAACVRAGLRAERVIQSIERVEAQYGRD